MQTAAAESKVERAQPEIGYLLPPWNVSESVREQFRKVRAMVCPQETTNLSIAVCSHESGEGVSWVASKLACAVAEISRNVTLLDASSAHHEVQSEIFGLTAGRPLPWDTTGRSTVFTSPSAHLTIVSAARNVEGSRTATDVSLAPVIGQLRDRGNIVIVDCDPMGSSAQVLQLGKLLDGVLFVVEAERQRREVIGRTLESLKRARIPIVGVLLNKRKQYIPVSIYRML